MGRPLRVLIVEDSEGDAALLIRQIRQGGYDPTFRRVDTPEAAAAALDEPWDVVISDYVLPSFSDSGPEALKLVKARCPDVPFVMVSGQVGEEIAVEAMRAGAHDYIAKANLSRLVPAIERELRDTAVRQQRKQLEEQLRRAQRLEMTGRLAAQVAHDFGNLLTPLIGYAQLLKRHLSPEHPSSKYCEALLNVVNQMRDLNSDLLTLGRRGRLDEEAVDLNGLAEQAVAQLVDRLAPARVELDLAPDLPPISGSSGQLLRVIANLLANARDAMPEGGRLAIKSERVHADQPLGRYTRIEPGEYVRLSVADTGCGIPPEILDRVFDLFFSTKTSGERRGSGLGLSIVQAIVDDHGGYVDVESEVGRGTVFSVYLPVRPVPAGRGRLARAQPRGAR